MSFGRPNVVSSVVDLDVNVSALPFTFAFANAGDSATEYRRCSITIQAENQVVESRAEPSRTAPSRERRSRSEQSKDARPPKLAWLVSRVLG